MFKKSLLEAFTEIKENKINWVVLIILPIMVVLMMGVELDKEVIDHVPMAVINYDNSTFSRELVNAFGNLDTFDIKEYPETEDQMESLLKNSEVRVGMIIPEGFYQDIIALKSPTVLMIYDGSHMSMTSAAKGKATEILLTYRAGATVKQLTGRLGMTYEEAMNVSRVFNFQNRVLYNPGQSFEDFLAIILMAGYAQGAIVLLASVSIDHMAYGLKKSERMGYPLGKVLAYTIIGTILFTVLILIQTTIIKIPFRGNPIDAIVLSSALSFAVSGFCVLISTVIENRMVALLGGAVVFIPNSVMAGTTWPLSSMPIGYQGFAKYTPFARYAVNLRDIYLKGIGMDQFGGDLRFMLIFGLVSLLISEMVLQLAETKEESYDILTDLP